MFGKERPKMIQLHPLKKKKGGSPLGGQWKENEKLPMLGGQWKEKEKLPMFGGQWKEKEKLTILRGQWKEKEKFPMLNGQWKEKEKVPFYPFSFFPQQILLKPFIFFSFDLNLLLYHGPKLLLMSFLAFPCL
jgi:hypothetical protein